MFDVDFNQHEPQVICHKDYQKFAPEILSQLANYNLQDHFILFSSGTTGGDLKGYALSKTSLFENAKAVNDFFGLTSQDVWGLSLPIYHIGGLSVLARAHLLGNKIIDGRSWNPESWTEKMKEVTITTVVPTQLYDLVQRKITPPKGIRYLIVGGDFLSEALKDEAIKLGWPVIRTFGMSEVCSQLANTKTPQSNDLEILPIHHVKIENERLLVKSSALFTLEFNIGKEFKVTLAKDLCTPDGYYQTKDRAMITENIFTHLGRLGDEFKIAGHLINLNQLKDALASYLLQKNIFNQMEFTIVDDERKGKKLVLLTLETALDSASVEEISSLIKPVKIDEVKVVPSFDRTALGKLKKI